MKLKKYNKLGHRPLFILKLDFESKNVRKIALKPLALVCLSNTRRIPQQIVFEQLKLTEKNDGFCN